MVDQQKLLQIARKLNLMKIPPMLDMFNFDENWFHRPSPQPGTKKIFKCYMEI